MAGRWSKVLVEPEMAAWTITAFSKLFSVTNIPGGEALHRHLGGPGPRLAGHLHQSSQVAGIRALPGSISPRASAMICMVEAVPIKEQAPQEGQA